MKHAILGAGAVGRLVGAALAHQGDRVTLLVRPQTHTQHPGLLNVEQKISLLITGITYHNYRLVPYSRIEELDALVRNSLSG